MLCLNEGCPTGPVASSKDSETQADEQRDEDFPFLGGSESPLPAARQVLQAYKDKPWGTGIKGSAETLRRAFTQKLVMLLH